MQEFLPWCSSSMRFGLLRIDYQISCRLNSIKANYCPWSRAWGLSPLNPPRGKLRLCPQRHHERSNSEQNEILTVHLQTAFMRTIIKSVVSVRPFVCFYMYSVFSINSASTLTSCVRKNVARIRLPSAGFRSWSPYLAVSLQVTSVVNPAVGCHYFPPGLQLPPQPLRGPVPISLLDEQRHDECQQFA